MRRIESSPAPYGPLLQGNAKANQKLRKFSSSATCVSMWPLMNLPTPTPIGIRRARADFGGLVDRVADGEYVLICRRSTPLAVLLPAIDLESFKELVRREQELEAVLRGRGYIVRPWTTPKILETLTKLGGQ